LRNSLMDSEPDWLDRSVFMVPFYCCLTTGHVQDRQERGQITRLRYGLSLGSCNAANKQSRSRSLLRLCDTVPRSGSAPAASATSSVAADVAAA
jgi:hypothetical protein